jgi:hypothetical protein
MARLFLTLLCSLNLTLSLFTAAALAAPAIAKRTVTAYLSAINEQVAVLNTQLSVLPTAGVAELSQVLVRVFFPSGYVVDELLSAVCLRVVAALYIYTGRFRRYT